MALRIFPSTAWPRPSATGVSLAGASGRRAWSSGTRQGAVPLSALEARSGRFASSRTSAEEERSPPARRSSATIAASSRTGRSWVVRRRPPPSPASSGFRGSWCIVPTPRVCCALGITSTRFSAPAARLIATPAAWSSGAGMGASRKTKTCTPRPDLLEKASGRRPRAMHAPTTRPATSRMSSSPL